MDSTHMYVFQCKNTVYLECSTVCRFAHTNVGSYFTYSTDRDVFMFVYVHLNSR